MENVPNLYFYRRIVHAKLFIDKNYSDKIDLDDIADEAYFSKFHFIRQFKKIYGKTPYQYLTQVRIEKARQLLIKNSVSEVCFLVGFESLSSFTGLFKRLNSLTPSQYQLQQRNIQTRISQSPLSFIPHCFTYQNGWIP